MSAQSTESPPDPSPAEAPGSGCDHDPPRWPDRLPNRLYDGYIFDLDGTIYLGNKLLPGALRLIVKLREMGKRVVFLSNNPTRDVNMYVEKLADLGLPTAAEEIVTTVHTTTQWILQNAPQAVVYPIAEEPLQRSLHQAGIHMSQDPARIDIIIASYDRGFDYAKLQIAYDALAVHKRARLICTNADLFCPLPDGRGEPDAGAIIAAIEACSGAKVEVNCGKPSAVMLDTVMNLMQLDARQCVMVGDRLYTEIRMGIDAGMDTALVLTGDTAPALLAETESSTQPSYVLDRIDRLLPAPVWAEYGWTA